MATTIKLQLPSQTGKIIVEAGHIYTNEEPSLEHILSAEEGKVIATFLGYFGYEIEKWLFVDNYNPLFQEKPVILNLPHYLQLLTQQGFNPDQVVYEADLAAAQAQETLDFLVNAGYAGASGDKTILYKDKILLYDQKVNRLGCDLLDACLYVEKLKRADACITILGKKWATQQKNTLTILKKLGADTTKIFPVFYPDGQTHPPTQSPAVYANTSSLVKPALELLHCFMQLSVTSISGAEP